MVSPSIEGLGDSSMTTADQIRRYVYENCALPARVKGVNTFRVRTGDVHRDMDMSNRLPAVCSAVGGRKFADTYGLNLIEREGPAQGANVYFTFAFASREVTAGEITSAIPKLAKAAKQKNERVSQTVRSLNCDSIFLVSCVGKKRNKPCPAKDLYISDWFQKARGLVERLGVRWFILSAEHGLVEPEQVLTPYEKTLNAMGVNERRAWASDLLAKLTTLSTPSFTFLAGQRYREFLIGPLQECGYKIQVPMEGLRIGEQLGWLQQQVE